MVGPKVDKNDASGVRYHALERMGLTESEWVFEELAIPMSSAHMILVRIALAKVEDTDGLAQLLRQIPIRQGEEGWNCVLWIKEALSHVEQSKDIVGTSVLDWTAVRDAALAYCQQKKDEHRFDGKGNFDTQRVPTYDLIQRREIIA